MPGQEHHAKAGEKDSENELCGSHGGKRYHARSNVARAARGAAREWRCYTPRVPSRGLVRSFVILWLVLGISLLVGSARTLLAALAPGEGRNAHLALLGGVEAAAALLFLVPPTLRVGAAGLLLTIVVAWLVHLHLHQFRWDLLVYAAAVLFVLVHGPLTRDQWKRALTRP